MESKAGNRKRNRRNKNNSNKRAKEEPVVVKTLESAEETKWEQVDLNTPVEVVQVENGFTEQEIVATNTSGVNSYNPFDEVQEDDIIRAPQTNDGSFHHVPTSEELL